MNDNPCYENCVNRSPARSPTREQCLAMQSVSGDVDGQAFQIEEKLNKVYEKRLAEINKEANGDASLKEITYLEWIATLRQINTTLITNIQHMENETSERLALLQRKVGNNCRYGQDNELCKCRKDMAGLMQLIRSGKYSGDWNVEKFNFETITKHDIFGNEADCCGSAMKYDTVECSKQLNSTDPRSCAVQKSKLIANVKALAVEVADKHDEIRDLKKQILSMEDEIQKAQKKILLKDDVIRELRNDLKSLPKCPSVVGARTSDRTTPTPCCLPMSEIKTSESSGMESPTTPRPSGCYSARDSINSLTCNPLEGIFGTPISLDVDEEEEFIKCLKEELNQVFDIRQSYDKNIEEHKRLLNEQQKSLNDYIDKLLMMNGNFQKKLRFYRHELLNLENSQCSDMDSGISSDCDPDLKILNSVRSRLGNLIEENQIIKREEQTMQIKFQDASSREKAKTELLDKTSNALQQVANALSHAICKPIAYDIIFGNCPNTTDNPLVDAVNELLEILKNREETIAELKTQTANSRKVQQELGTKSQELRHELCDVKQSV